MKLLIAKYNDSYKQASAEERGMNRYVYASIMDES
jgi:hypothetical protein